jgi:NTP pyrophosphatase (non-canonical NTP hydrolase)
MIEFARSELTEVEEELTTLRNLKVEAVGELVATVSWPTGPAADGYGPDWNEEQDEQDACCRRLEGELGDVLFDALLLARKCEVATAGKVSLSGALAVAAEKVRRRCPHVFAGEPAPTRADAEAIWQREKAKERQRASVRVELAPAPPAAEPQQKIKVMVQEAECSSDEDEDASTTPQAQSPVAHGSSSIVDLSSAAVALGSSIERLVGMSDSDLDEELEEKLGVKRSIRQQICKEKRQHQQQQQEKEQQEQAAAAAAAAATAEEDARGKVRDEMRAAEAADDGGASVLKERGAKAFKAKNYEEAADLYGAAAMCAPTDATHPANQSFALLRAKQPQGAVDAGMEAVRRKPDWAKAHYRLGAALAALNTAEGNAAAAESLGTACELDSDNIQMATALRDVRKAIDAALTAATSNNNLAKETEQSPAPAPAATAPMSPADIGRGVFTQQPDSDRTVPKPSRIKAEEVEEVEEEEVVAVEAPELPKAKVNPVGSLTDDLPVPKGPNNPADAVNAALDKARSISMESDTAAAKATAAKKASAASSSSEASQQGQVAAEPGDQEGVYKRWPICRTVIEGKGRALKAARPLMAGAVVYQARPWVSVVADGFMRSVCSHCFKSTADEGGGEDDGPPPDLPFSCAGCSACGYCSQECKDAAAHLHAKECESVAQVVRMTAGTSADSRGARMLIRALAQRAVDLEGGDEEALRKRSVNLPSFVDVCELEDHLNDLPRAKQKEFLGIAAGVGSLPIGQQYGVGKVELVRLVATLRCNSQAVVDVANKRLGDVLIAPADFNHSCRPNCTVAFYGNTVQIRALCEIDPDEELTIQYTDLYLSRHERQEKLLSSHCFTCACPRCCEGGGGTGGGGEGGTLDCRVEGYRCGLKRCDGLVPPPLHEGGSGGGVEWVCVKCGASHSHRADALRRSAAEAKVVYATAIESSRRGDYEAARTLLEDLIAKHSPSLFWQHSVLYNAHHALFSACNALEDTEDATSAASKALACIRATYPPFHPVRT